MEKDEGGRSSADGVESLFGLPTYVVVFFCSITSSHRVIWKEAERLYSFVWNR